jgi:hypothetical protein
MHTPTPTHTHAQHSTAQHSTAQHSTAQHSTAQHSTAQHSTAQHSTAQHTRASQLRSQLYVTTWPLTATTTKAGVDVRNVAVVVALVAAYTHQPTQQRHRDSVNDDHRHANDTA